MNQNLFIEETTPTGYVIRWQGSKGITEMDIALKELLSIQSPNRLELWSKCHAASPKGYAPIGFRLPLALGGTIYINQTLKMLLNPIDIPS
jgi:hypothetical protein